MHQAASARTGPPSAGARPPDCMACGVRRLALFQAFEPAVLAELQTLRRETRLVPAGGVVVPIDRPPRHLFTVYRGWTFSFRMTPEGRRQIVDFHLVGDLVGTELLAAMPQAMGVAALTPVALCVFDAAQMMHAARAVPALGAALAWMASREEAMLAERLTSLGRRDALVRVGHLLLDLSTRQGWREAHGAADCWWPLTNVHLADTLGLTPEHVSRTLGRLRALKLVELHSGRLLLPDPARLIAMTGWSPSYLQPRPLL